MEDTQVKIGDLIKCKYKWGNDYLEGAGYVYKANELHVGVSAKNGGTINLPLSELIDVEVLIPA